LLQALGWTTQNRNEVGLEEKISRGRVDYSLKIKGSPKIYIEAKPPRARLTKAEAISQAITYGYNKRSVQWVLLTDFQELRLFDVTIRPNKRNLEAGLRLDLTYDLFLDRFENLGLLSKESVESGLLDRSLLSKKLDRLRRPVDREILEDMKRWREGLAKDIFRNHPDMTKGQLKENVQRIFDRIIFIRSCEDRGLTYGETLQEMVAQWINLLAMVSWRYLDRRRIIKTMLSGHCVLRWVWSRWLMGFAHGYWDVLTGKKEKIMIKGREGDIEVFEVIGLKSGKGEWP